MKPGTVIYADDGCEARALRAALRAAGYHATAKIVRGRWRVWTPEIGAHLDAHIDAALGRGGLHDAERKQRTGG